MARLKFKPVEGAAYKYDYEAIFRRIAERKARDKRAGTKYENGVYRGLILDDLFFIVYFVFQIEEANHPFVLKACRDVEVGEKDYTLDIWGRYHYKTTVITKAETIQEILKNPEERIGIFSHTKSQAKSFLRGIMTILEKSEMLKICFPDILFENPANQAPKWSEEDGIIVKRTGYYSEGSIEACGLLEGMPTGKHYTIRKYDDIETKDTADSPEIIYKLKRAFNLSANLGVAKGGSHRVVGTPYSNDGLIQWLRYLKDDKGNLVYKTRLKPSTVDGTINGKPVFIDQDKLDKLKINLDEFITQHLLDPTPRGIRKLEATDLIEVDFTQIPTNLHKFILVDPAGDDKTGEGDAWAIMCVGVAVEKDDVGASSIYILDMVVSPLRTTEAISTVVDMYIRNGKVLQVCVEKTGTTTFEMHISDLLFARKKIRLSEERRNLVLLKPAGRNKAKKIEDALQWPLSNKKIHISKNIPIAYRDRFATEIDNFPRWHDDSIEALSYLYDVIQDYHFPRTDYSDIPLVKMPSLLAYY